MKAEKLIKDYTKRCSNVLCAVEDKYGKKVISCHEWLTPEQALKAVQIEGEEVIEKAVKWLSNLSLEDMEYKYDSFDTSEGWYRMIDDLKKQMEE